jgi:hypothetical protein
MVLLAAIKFSRIQAARCWPRNIGFRQRFSKASRAHHVASEEIFKLLSWRGFELFLRMNFKKLTT